MLHENFFEGRWVTLLSTGHKALAELPDKRTPLL
jgi:hypothetical protein